MKATNPAQWAAINAAFTDIIDKVDKAYEESTVYPPKQDIMNAFRLIPKEGIKVCILGQDPYHGKDQANGLAFSVNAGQKLPPSLKNIFRELKDDVGVEATVGDLTPWAKQGVLLLNTALTVVEGMPGSHLKLWENFTQEVIKRLILDEVLFLLWGNHAFKAYHQALNTLRKNGEDVMPRYLDSSHPCPLAAYRGFLGCKHFSKANKWLDKPIDWTLP